MKLLSASFLSIMLTGSMMFGQTTINKLGPSAFSPRASRLNVTNAAKNIRVAPMPAAVVQTPAALSIDLPSSSNITSTNSAANSTNEQPKPQVQTSPLEHSRMQRSRTPLPRLLTLDVLNFGAACDGFTDDARAIQSAIEAASANGGVITFSKLCGVGDAGLTISGNNVTLQGIGQSGGLKILAAGPSFSTFSATTVRFVGCKNCNVEGLFIDGNGISSNPIGMKETTSSRITGIHVVRAGGFGAVVTMNNQGNTYSNNVIEDGVGIARGLWIGNASENQMEMNASIIGNQVSRMGATGIVCTCVDSQINNNLSTHNGGSGIIFPAAGIYRASKVSATGNTVSFNKFSGFQSDASSNQTYSEFITLSHNIVEGNVSSGIYVVRARDWDISGNEVRNNLIHGIEIGEAKRINVNKNLVEETRIGSDRTQIVGIHVSAQATGTNDVEQVEITGNTTQNNVSNGIFLVNCSPNTMTGVNVQGNTTAGNGAYGIRASAAQVGEITSVSITDNILTNNGTGPLRVDLIDAHLAGNQ